ncbi:cohesin domain-containing protein [Patescibacteria group bacterium]
MQGRSNLLTQNKKECTKTVLVLFCAFLILVCIPPQDANAAGASLYFAPGAGTYVIGSSFKVSVKVNSGGEVINAAEGAISYDTNLLEATGISKGGSIFPYWTTEPSYSGGSISFGGGLPPPAFNGSAGHIITITFRAKKAGSASVRFTSGAALAHDGKGTNILASMGSASYTISPQVEAPKPGDKPGPTQPQEVEQEYNKPEIKSSTHPDPNKWYKTNLVKFNWELEDTVTGVSISFDQEPNTDPGPVSDGKFSEKEYLDTEDGVWYLHLKFKDARRWGTIAHFRVMIDTRPPLPFDVQVKEVGVGEWPILSFETTDEDSGLKEYEVIIGSLEEKSHIVEKDIASLEVQDLEVGEHIAMVKAIDNAGNETYSKVTFTIKPIETPAITNYSKEFKPTDQFFMNGTSLPNVTINAYIQKDTRLIITETVQSNNNGDWFYIYNNKLENGRYVAWVEAVNEKGIKSGPSNKVSFLVSPPVFTQIGSLVINYFTVIASLLFLIILIVVLIFWLIGLIRKRLKKETVEIEQVLHKNLVEYENELDQEFAKLSKFEGKQEYKTEKTKTKQKLKKNIDTIEKKILKEIKDVEDILK